MRPNDPKFCYSWWRHQMGTFYALLAICVWNLPVLGEFPTQKPVTRSLDVFFDLRLNKRLSKHTWGWWFETLPRPLWRHNNVKHINNSNNDSIDHKRNTPSRGQSQNCQPDKTVHPQSINNAYRWVACRSYSRYGNCWEILFRCRAIAHLFCCSHFPKFYHHWLGIGGI